MKATYTKIINGSEWRFELEEETLQEFLKKASFLSQIPTACGNCKKTTISFAYRYLQSKYHYYEMRCTSCSHRLCFGEFQSGGMFVKEDWERPYGRGEELTHPPGHADAKTRHFPTKPMPNDFASGNDFLSQQESPRISPDEARRVFAIAKSKGMNEEQIYQWLYEQVGDEIFDHENNRVSARLLTRMHFNSILLALDKLPMALDKLPSVK
jgi:hypothetical protein